MSKYWRHALLILLALGSLVALLSQKPIPQDRHYHAFADHRTLLGVQNFSDVISNVPFLLVGAAGFRFCLGFLRTHLRMAWMTFFVGVSLVGVGSAYYHWQPRNETLVWDRLPMTIGFMAMFVALLGEYINERLGRYLLVPALLVGFSSVVYWDLSDDLRFYAWVQFLPLLTIPVLMLLFRSPYSHQWLLGVALAGYGLAKVCEAYDHQIFGLTGNLVAGHALKHVLAALGCYVLLEMLRRRQDKRLDSWPALGQQEENLRTARRS